MSIRCEAAGDTDVGRIRKGNEDAFLIEERGGFFLVADGMGGHAAGEIASALTREAVSDAVLRGLSRAQTADDVAALFAQGAAAASEACDRYVAEHRGASGMGTTLTACVVRPSGEAHVAQIGDSRAYLVRNGEIRQITRDHTWVQDQIDAGRLDPRAARSHSLSHVITRALGPGDHAPPDVFHLTVDPGDLLLLCSDGLTGMLDDEELHRELSAEVTLQARVNALIDAANERGGTDNITAIVVRIAES